MPFTAEQKRELRKKRKLEAQQQELDLNRKMMELAPPQTLLKRPHSKKDVGNSNVDHGGHQKALNFPMTGKGPRSCAMALVGIPEVQSSGEKILLKVIKHKIGTYSIGLAYEGDWKQKSRLAGNGERDLCQNSEKHIQFLLLVKEAVAPLVHPTLRIVIDDTLRLNCLFGARTLSHTDSFRGNTPNMLYIPKQEWETGWLCYDTFPKFKYSLVKLFGKFYVPHSYSEASNECRLIGEDPREKNKPIFFVFKADVIDHMEPYGEFNFGVIGFKAKATTSPSTARLAS